MAKPRVYELAKVLNVDSKTVLEKLKDMGEFVKSASSTIEPPVARRLKQSSPRTTPRAIPSPCSSAARPHLRPRLPLHLPHRLRPLPHVRHRLPRHISRLRLRVHRHRVRRAAHAPACRPPAATVRTTTVRMVAIIAKAVRTVVRVARTIAVTTIVVTTRPSEQWPAGSASEQPRQCFGSAPARSGRRRCQWRQCRFKCDSAPARSGPAPGQQPVLPQAGMHTPDAG